MYKALLLLFWLMNLMVAAQDEAYFLRDVHGYNYESELFRVSLSEGLLIQQSYSFQDTVMPEYANLAPAHATIFFEDRTTEWNLLDTHYGRHFKRPNKPLYLAPR